MPFESRIDGSIEMLNDLGIIIRNCVDVVHFEIFRVIGVFLRFVATEKTPAAIKLVIWRFAIHEPDRQTVYCDSIRRLAGTTPQC